MKKFKSLDAILTIILFILTVLIIVLQIVFSGSNSTKLETSLFSIVQFILSLAFSYLLARITLKEEFHNSQKKFAISAYRRITEINLAVERLIRRTSLRMISSNPEINHELDVITEITFGIRESIHSSISDWSEIIGEEIDKVEKIRQLQEQESEQDKSKTINGSNNEDKESKKNIEAQISRILETLPSELRSTAKKSAENSFYQRLNKAKKSIFDEKKEKGYIELDGFFEIGFDMDVKNFSVGDKLVVRIGDVENRIGALIAYSEDGRTVGVITNKLAGIGESYADAANLLIHTINKSVFEIELLHIGKRTSSKRRYFTGKLIEKEPVLSIETDD